jgi:hypothetical protein
VLILPPGHAQAVGAGRRLTAREKWMVRSVAAVVAVIAVALIVSFATGGPTSAKGCIYATIPGPVGAQQISECGSTARSTCASVFRPGAYTADSARTVADACRKARLPVGS